VSDGCGAPAGGAQTALAQADIARQAVVQGRVRHNGDAVSPGYARLLNGDGEFVAEVPLGEDGSFRFFAAPGGWTVRVLAPGGITASEAVTAGYGRIAEVDIQV
jgi:Protein of unknown function (DUF1416)